MSEKFEIEGSRIKFEGVFDWEGLYSAIVGWFFQKKFDYYEDRNVKKPGPYGYEKEFVCVGERDESGYVRHVIKVALHGYHMEDIEVAEKGGKKKMTRTGMMTIYISPMLELDWQHKWDKRFKKKARTFLHKYMMRGFIDEQKEKLTHETYKLYEEIKKELKLEGS